MPVFYLSEKIYFPPPELSRKDGLLAIGGDLCTERLILAYQNGIFPWYSKEYPILWWSPDPRLVLYPDELHVSGSLEKILKQGRFSVTFDQNFYKIITECSFTKRKNQEGTWITQDMLDAYCLLHEEGFAHSVEVWKNEEIVGGLYGVSLGKCFFGESMFSRKSNASKVGFATLVSVLNKWAFSLIDCQVTTRHLVSFGAREISRRQFIVELRQALQSPTLRGKWKMPSL